MNKLRVYLYDSTQGDNGYRGTDYTNYVLQGGDNTEKLNDELDTSTITLQGLDRREEFEPETKFIIDVCNVSDEPINGQFVESVVETLHRVVDQDTVSQPQMSDDNYFTHAISLIEPSVIMQKRAVDNIAMTYKLKDVNLEIGSGYSGMTNPVPVENNSNPTAMPGGWSNFGQAGPYNEVVGQTLYKYYSMRWGKYFDWQGIRPPVGINGKVWAVKEDGASPTELQYISNAYGRIKIHLPTPYIMWGLKDTGDYTPIGAAGYFWIVEKNTYNESEEWETVASGTVYSSNNLDHQDLDGMTKFPLEMSENMTITINDDVMQNCLIESIGKTNRYQPRPLVTLKRYTSCGYPSEAGQDLTTVDVYTDAFEIEPDYKYRLTVRIANLDISLNDLWDDPYTSTGEQKSNSASPAAYSSYRTDYSITRTGTLVFEGWNEEPEYPTPDSNDSFQATFYCYDAAKSKAIITKSGNPYSAYYALQKAIINSGNYEKVTGVPINDTQDARAPYPFYIDDEFEDALSMARVNEEFFMEKNLWEVTSEIASYIHAIPELRFGRDNKFLITFRQLGGVDEKESLNTRLSVMNFRGVDDYVSAVTSYVDNLVQLGGKITEYVSPKTSSENFLVSNNDVVLKTSKPILELLEITIKAGKAYSIPYDGQTLDITVGEKADLTPFVYESGVYQILPIVYNEYPNKGAALYYRLGDNVIRGCQYQLPNPSTNAYSDYAIKKIIFFAYYGGYISDAALAAAASGPWDSIKVNDFVFKITYRTKDSTRTEHARPDLRKYLVSSPKDIYPRHEQFNQQQDTYVDSFAFGNNIYGKLIRTGNTNYTIVEWSPDANTIKHKGELYIIDDDLYFVAKVKHTYFSSYIQSEVEYSRNYNQLSKVIGIPSEPRFYEISEQSHVRRERNIPGFLLLTNDRADITASPQRRYISSFDELRKRMFLYGSHTYYALTQFKGDPDTKQTDTFGLPTLSTSVLVPVNTYASGTSLIFEWDMVDNFSAGDASQAADNTGLAVNDAYRELMPVQYPDYYGKAALFSFNIAEYYPADYNETMVLPNVPENVTHGAAIATSTNDLVLAKDSREAISFNLNLEMLTSSDTFVLSPFLFEESKSNGYVFFLNKEIDKVTNGYFDKSAIISEIPLRSFSGATINESPSYITIRPLASPVVGDNINGVPVTDVKAIVFGFGSSLPTDLDNLPAKIKFMFAKNIPAKGEDEDLQHFNDRAFNNPMYIGSPDFSFFSNQQ